MVGGYGNIWRTTPLIKPKERHVLSFHAARRRRRWHCIALYCAQATRVGQLHQLYLERERALARKFAPIPFHSRARRDRTRVAAETGKTDGRNEIFRSDCARRRRDACCSFAVHCAVSPSLSLSVVLHFPSTVTSASSIGSFRLESAALVSRRAIN